MMQQILTMLANIQENLNMIQQTQNMDTNMLNTLLQQNGMAFQASQVPNNIVLPLNSMESFDELEMKLKNVDTFSAVVCQFNINNLRLHYIWSM